MNSVLLCQKILKLNKFICFQSSGNEQENFEWRSEVVHLKTNHQLLKQTLFWRACIFLLFSSICFLDLASAWSLASFSSLTLSARIFLFVSCCKITIQCRTEGITWTVIKYSCTNNNYCAFFLARSVFCSPSPCILSLIIELMMTNCLDNLSIIFFLNGW